MSSRALVFSAFAFVLLPACQTAYYAAMEKVGYAKRDILSSRVKSARDAQEAAKNEIVSALEQFSRTVNFQGGELEAQYKRLDAKLKDGEDAAEAVRKRIADVQDVGDALFREWRAELAQYNSADLRRRSEQQLLATQSRYTQMVGAMKQAESRMEPALRPLRDQVLFMKHNLNARAVGSLKGEVAKVDSEVNRLIADINRAVGEANRFVQELDKAE
jgi:outer membrane murein-binding lipoprotein Lpp